MSINFDVFDKEIKSHMKNQPYALTCSECGTGLDCSDVSVDSDFDLSVKINPCQTCIDDAVNEIKTEMESNND